MEQVENALSSSLFPLALFVLISILIIQLVLYMTHPIKVIGKTLINLMSTQGTCTVRETGTAGARGQRCVNANYGQQ